MTEAVLDTLSQAQRGSPVLALRSALCVTPHAADEARCAFIASSRVSNTLASGAWMPI